MGSNSQTTNSSQQSSFQPWNVAIPGLTNIINQLSNGGSPLTGPQANAVSNLQSSAGSVPNFGNAAAGGVNGIFNTNAAPQIGLWNNALQTSQNTLSPYLDPNYTNPMNTPGFSQALSTANQDITNSINGQFAAAGRANSPANTQALARGLSQGEGQLIANQYNANVGQQLGAEGQFMGNAANTAAGTAQLGQIPVQDTLSGIQAATALPGVYTSPASAQLQAANIGQQLPFENLQLQSSLLAGLGGLGGSSQGTGTSTTTQPVNALSTGAGIGMGVLALF